MPNLIEGPSPLKIDYAVSLPHSLLATVGLMCAAPNFEGLGDWLHEARTQLAPDLLAELCLLSTFPGRYQRFTGELSARFPAQSDTLDFEGLMAHLGNLSSAEYQQIALQALGRGTTPPTPPAEVLALLEQPDEWAAYLARIESQVDPETVALFAQNGGELKSRLLTALNRFWQELYAGEFKATRPLMERSVAHHRVQAYPPSFRDLFVIVTGRRLPEQVDGLLPTVTRVTFVPSCYIGPYVAYSYHGEHLIFYYNCRSTPVGPAVTDGAALYPPLKALGDETRLQILALLRGREMYAQEIVDQLDISQPAVSRHLNLMAAAGVLQVRREGNAKYYAVNAETLTRLADALRAFV
jgi:hypothetical protein